jgi:hypothetical protein
MSPVASLLIRWFTPLRAVVVIASLGLAGGAVAWWVRPAPPPPQPVMVEDQISDFLNLLKSLKDQARDGHDI